MTDTVKLRCGECGSDIDAPYQNFGSASERHQRVREISADWREAHAPCLEAAARYEVKSQSSDLYPDIACRRCRYDLEVDPRNPANAIPEHSDSCERDATVKADFIIHPGVPATGEPDGR